jgi:hypothetical protein
LPQKTEQPFQGCSVSVLQILFNNYFVAGATGAVGIAGAVGAGATVGASTFGVSAGFCSSAFLQPTTARDREAKKSTLTKMANIFFIKAHPPFTDFSNFGYFIPPNF